MGRDICWTCIGVSARMNVSILPVIEIEDTRFRHPNGAFTNSSPHSSVTGISANRLTLPPSHQQPEFTNRKPHPDDERAANAYSVRPGSRNLEYDMTGFSPFPGLQVSLTDVAVGNMHTCRPEYSRCNQILPLFRTCRLHHHTKPPLSAN